MDRETWIAEASRHLQSAAGWPAGQADPYAASLYETYVVEDDSWNARPAAAVEEDMTYWDD